MPKEIFYILMAKPRVMPKNGDFLHFDGKAEGEAEGKDAERIYF